MSSWLRWLSKRKSPTTDVEGLKSEVYALLHEAGYDVLIQETSDLSRFVITVYDDHGSSWTVSTRTDDTAETIASQIGLRPK